MLRRHFPPARIERLCAAPWSIKPGERAELAIHLSTSCRRCWAAVSAIAPGVVELSCDPVAEALCHVTTPKRRAVLMADHLAAVDRVQRRPFGFAFLLVEEANSLACDAETPIPLENDAFQLIGALRPRRGNEHHDDLYAVALSYLSILRSSREETDAARMASVMAERHRLAGTGDERVGATVLEAHALLQAAEGDPRAAEALLSAAQERLATSSEHALRRFELLGRLADVLIGAGQTGRVAEILPRANRLLETARLAEDPVWRAQAILKRARLTAFLADRMGWQAERLRSAARWAADELENAEALFAAATDAPTQTLRLLCLARLYSFFDGERAGDYYQAAMSRIRPEGRTFFPFPSPPALFVPETLPSSTRQPDENTFGPGGAPALLR